MNERIKELYKQAHDNIQDCDGRLYYDENFNPGKFAELIVKECAHVAAMFSVDKNDIHPEIKWDNMNDSAKMIAHTTSQQISWKITDHFGVE